MDIKKSICKIVLESETTGKWPQVPHRHGLYPVASCSLSRSWLHWWWSPCYGLNWVEQRACMSHQRQDERVWGGLITTPVSSTGLTPGTPCWRSTWWKGKKPPPTWDGSQLISLLCGCGHLFHILVNMDQLRKASLISSLTQNGWEIIPNCLSAVSHFVNKIDWLHQEYFGSWEW